MELEMEVDSSESDGEKKSILPKNLDIQKTDGYDSTLERSEISDSKVESSEIPEETGNSGRSCHNFRRSDTLVILVGFFALLIDTLLKTGLDPALPVLVADVHDAGYDAANRRFRNVENDNETRLETALIIRQQTVILMMLHPTSEFVFSFIAAYSVDHLGTKIPLIVGSVVVSIGCVGIGVSPYFWALCLSRIATGMACAFSSVPSLALVTARFKDDQKRTTALVTASIGQIIGGNFGATIILLLYDLFGRLAPFLFIGVLCAVDIFLRILVVSDATGDKLDEKKKDLKTLIAESSREIRDVYVVLLLLIAVAIAAVRLMKSSLVSEWQIFHLKASLWQLAIINLIGGCVAIIAIQIPRKHYRIHPKFTKAKVLFLGCVGSFVAFVLYPLCDKVWLQIVPDVFYRIFLNMAWLTLTALCGLISTERFGQKHGILFGFLQASLNFGRIFGGIVAVTSVRYLHFDGLMFLGAGVVALCVFPALFFEKIELAAK